MNHIDFTTPIPEEEYDEKTGTWIIKHNENYTPSNNTTPISQDVVVSVDDILELSNSNFLEKLDESIIDNELEKKLDFNINLLDNLSNVSNSILKRGQGREEQILIPFDIIEYINGKTGSDIKKYINNHDFKNKVISVLSLSGQYGFFIDNLKASIILIPINTEGNELKRKVDRRAGIGHENLNYIFSSILFLDTKVKRIAFVDSISSQIDLPNMGAKELSEYFASGNYLKFMFHKLSKEVFNLGKQNIDKEISIGLAGYMLREDFDMEMAQINEFFNIISKLVSVPNSNDVAINIPLDYLENILQSKNLNIQKYITNPIFKKKIRQILKLEKNYGLVVDTDKSNIVLFPIDSSVKRYAGINKEDIKFVISNILKLDTKEKRTKFLDYIISNVDLSKMSELEIFDKFNSKNYVNFIFIEVGKAVFSLAKGNIDSDAARGVAGSLLRDNFDFVNSSIGCNVLEKFSMTLGLNISRLYRIDEDLEQKLRTSIDVLEDLLKTNLGVLYNDIEVNNFRKNFSNDIFTDFSEKVKNSFSHIGFPSIDENLVKGMFMYSVNKGNIKNPMLGFTEIVFSKIDSKTKELSKLFGFFNSHVIKIGKEEYKYPNFKFRDIELDDDKYSVEKIFNLIKDKIERTNVVNEEITKLERPLVEIKFLISSNRKMLLSAKENIPKIEAELKDLDSYLSDMQKNIPKGVFNFAKKKKHLEEIVNLEDRKKSLEEKLQTLKNNVYQLNEDKFSLLSQLSKNTENYEIINLKQEQKKLEEQIERIKEDFSNTLFYGLRQDKKISIV